MLPGSLALWSGAYLHEVALRVDQVALMSYDTALSTVETYAGYVRRTTEAALAAVPPEVDLFIGVPAYHEESFYHHAEAETLGPALRGVRLALGAESSLRCGHICGLHHHRRGLGHVPPRMAVMIAR